MSLRSVLEGSDLTQFAPAMGIIASTIAPPPTPAAHLADPSGSCGDTRTTWQRAFGSYRVDDLIGGSCVGRRCAENLITEAGRFQTPVPHRGAMIDELGRTTSCQGSPRSEQARVSPQSVASPASWGARRKVESALAPEDPGGVFLGNSPAQSRDGEPRYHRRKQRGVRGRRSRRRKSRRRFGPRRVAAAALRRGRGSARAAPAPAPAVLPARLHPA
jgi:hypothetical protein